LSASPLWDVIFGTVWRPKPDEFPATGATSGDVPAGFVDLIVWPVRHRFARAVKIDSATDAPSPRDERVITAPGTGSPVPIGKDCTEEIHAA